MAKLNKTEKAAKLACESIERLGGGDFSLVWTKSATWGHTAQVLYRREKVGYAGGCGYDKESAAVCDFLRFLISDIVHASGAGMQAVQDRSKKSGWELKIVYSGRTEEGYYITKL